MAKRKGQFRKGLPKDPRIAKGGKRPGAGRPTDVKREAKKLVTKLAIEMAMKYLEDHLQPILDSYISSAGGPSKRGLTRKYDPASNRHAVERVIGPAPRRVILDMQETIETFFEEAQRKFDGGEEDSEKEEA